MLTNIIKPKDAVVYLTLRKYENWETHETFVSIATIAEKLHLSRKYILEAVDRLEKAGYIAISKGRNNRNIYHFNEYKTFQGFSDEFLDNPNLSIEERGVAYHAILYFKVSSITDRCVDNICHFIFIF